MCVRVDRYTHTLADRQSAARRLFPGVRMMAVAATTVKLIVDLVCCTACSRGRVWHSVNKFVTTCNPVAKAQQRRWIREVVGALRVPPVIFLLDDWLNGTLQTEELLKQPVYTTDGRAVVYTEGNGACTPAAYSRRTSKRT